MLSQLAQIIQDIVLTLGYPGIAFLMFAENLFPPIPSELIMPFAGFVAGQGKLDLFLAWIVGTAGVVAGAIVIYYLGWFAGDVVVRNFLRRYGRWVGISEPDYDRSLEFFRKHGEWTIFVGRMIPLIRTVISIPAGAEKMPMPKFLILTTLGSAIWCGLLVLAGYALGDRYEEVLGFIDQYQTIVVILLVIAIVLVVAWFIYNRFFKKQEA
jgi:membrane protein DedA with SNARE-associated domain